MAEPQQVAIITRTKERKLLLSRAVESVLGQTFQNWVHVIVNDGGDPAIVDDLLQSYREKYGKRLQVLHHTTAKGMQTATNEGIAASRSQYIVVHDDDDTWAPNYLEACVKFLEEKGADSPYQGVITKTERVYEKIHANGEIQESHRLDHVPLDFVSLYRVGFENPFPPIAFLFRRSAFEQIGSFESKYSVLGDWDFHFRFLQRFEVGVVPEKLAFYHWRLSSPRNEDENTVTAQLDEHFLKLNELTNDYLRQDIAKGLLFSIPRLQFENHRQLQYITDEQIRPLQNAISELQQTVNQIRDAANHASYMSGRLEQKLKAPNLVSKWLIRNYEFIKGVFSGKWLPFKQRDSDYHFQKFHLAPGGKVDKATLQRRIDDADLLCLDVFDTCLHRIFAKPTDLFSLLAEHTQALTGLTRKDFMRERMESETQARERSPTEDTNIYKIYDRFTERNHLPAELGPKLAKREITLEAASTYPNPIVLELFKYAKQTGKPLLYLSDMYLPAVEIKKLLRSNGFDKGDVWVSSETGLSKFSGSIFRELPKRTGYRNEKILLLDDNLQWAIEPARNQRIEAFHLNGSYRPKCLAEEVDQGRISSLESPIESLTVGLARKRRHNSVSKRRESKFDPASNETAPLTSHEIQFWEDLGYQFAGPLYFGYTHWMIHRAKERGLDCLVFLSRDGYYLQKTFDILKEHWHVPLTSRYLYSSRRFLTFATITELNPRAINFLLRPNSALTLRDYFQRLDLSYEQHEDLARFHGFESGDEPITAPEAGFISHGIQDRIHRLFDDLSEEILKTCSAERQKLIGYLKSSDYDPRNSAIVDVGWLASSINSMTQISRDCFGASTHGFYFATWHFATELVREGCSFESYFSHLGKPTYRDKLLIEAVAVIEKFFGAPHPPVLSMRQTGEIWAPIFAEPTESASRMKQIYEHLWEGASHYVTDMATVLDGPVKDYGHGILEALFDRLLHHPTEEEARFLGQLQHRESFGNVPARSIIQFPSPQSANKQEILHNLLASDWRKGCLTLMDERQLKKIGDYRKYLKQF